MEYCLLPFNLVAVRVPTRSMILLCFAFNQVRGADLMDDICNDTDDL
jgi:hypothetical protein